MITARMHTIHCKAFCQGRRPVEHGRCKGCGMTVSEIAVANAKLESNRKPERPCTACTDGKLLLDRLNHLWTCWTCGHATHTPDIKRTHDR